MTVARYAVFILFALSVLVAAGGWLVRSRALSPFSALGRGLRTATDFVLDPVEKRLVRMGGNPAHAGWWLIVIVAVAGVVFLSLADWLQGFFLRLSWAAGAGPRQLLVTLVVIAHSVLVFSLIVRVIGSWVGVFRYAKWMRPFYALTDWLVEPIARVVPSVGPFDVSPLVALLVLWVLKAIVLIGLGA